MSQVTSLGLPRMETDSGPTYRKIRRASRLFGWLFTALLWSLSALAAAMALAMLFYAGPHLQVTPTHFELTENDAPLRNAVVVGTLPLVTKLAYAVAALVRTAPAIMIFWHLRALFSLYGEGVVFSQQNGLHIQKVGLWLIAAAVTPLVCHLLLSASGVEIDHAWFHMDEVQAFVLGGLVFVIAQVMQVGREIEEDRSQFV